MSWFQELQPASFSGVPFGVTGGQLRVGRRNAVHQYPFKDEVWVEDLGRAARRITLVGFLVEKAAYGGFESVIRQRERLIAALESPGKGTLVHPTLGTLQVSVLDSSFTERWDKGRVFEFTLMLIEGGDRVFPADDPDTSANVKQACDDADAAAQTNFVAKAQGPLAAGEAVVKRASDMVSQFTSQVTSAVRDATNLVRTVASLPGNFGRFVAGNLRSINGEILSFKLSISGTVSGLIAAGAAARSAVNTTCSLLGISASSLQPSTSGAFAAQAQAVTASLLASTTDPADGVRLLSGVGVVSGGSVPASTVGDAMATMQSACSDLFRRAAVVSVARAASDYQPSSFDDAVALRNQVCDLLDAEIQTAGDQGEDESYSALRAVRVAVVQDLTARGGDLAKLTTVTSARPVPSLVLAQRLYRDSTRSDELVTEADPIHPAFMPVSFKALAQ